MISKWESYQYGKIRRRCWKHSQQSIDKFKESMKRKWKETYISCTLGLEYRAKLTLRWHGRTRCVTCSCRWLLSSLRFTAIQTTVIVAYRIVVSQNIRQQAATSWCNSSSFFRSLYGSSWKVRFLLLIKYWNMNIYCVVLVRMLVSDSGLCSC